MVSALSPASTQESRFPYSPLARDARTAQKMHRRHGMCRVAVPGHEPRGEHASRRRSEGETGHRLGRVHQTIQVLSQVKRVSPEVGTALGAGTSI